MEKERNYAFANSTPQETLTPTFEFIKTFVEGKGESIVARECGIPAVMATHTATRSIKNGQMITVDGSEGTVTIDE